MNIVIVKMCVYCSNGSYRYGTMVCVSIRKVVILGKAEYVDDYATCTPSVLLTILVMVQYIVPTVEDAQRFC